MATVSGTAYDNAGKPLSGVTVTIDGPTHKTVTSDASGHFTFSVPPGLYSIRATHAGFDAAAANEVALVAGQNVQNFDVSMTQQTLQSLRTIGVVRTTNTRSIFNTSALSVSTINAATIDARMLPNLSKEVGELPGVGASQNSGGRDPNTRWDIRGAGLETKVELDGHTVSSGVFGTYNSVYANSEIFDQVEVLKGAGLNGVNAGESAFGTVNLRTRGFTGTNTVTATGALGSYASSHYFVSLEHNITDRFSILAARSQQDYLGPDQGVPGPVLSSLNGTTGVGYSGPGLIQWQQDLSHPYQTNADLIKARYKISNATTITGEFLNLTGRYFSQGASYAYDYGPFTIAECANGKTFSVTAANCTTQSTYTNPRQFNLVGTTQQVYSYFPNSSIINQEPQFSAELRTTLGNDTIFIRPYWTEIKRSIDGSTENLQPGNAGAWYQVTNSANCTVQFTAPGAKGAPAAGATGPCFTSADNYTTPYVNNAGPTLPTYFPTTSTAPNCSATSPCYTTPTQVQRNGLWAYGTPFSQPEFDKDNGVTFSWLHPVNDNLYSFNVDYSDDYTTKYTADNSPLPNGCVPVVGGGPNKNTPYLSDNVTPNPYYQRACNNGGAPFGGTTGSFAYTLPSTAVQIPPTHNYKADVSLTALWQLTPRLQVGLGNYLTIEKLDYQYTDPNAALAASLLKSSAGVSLAGAEPADATLLPGTVTHTHYDPHIQAQYRLTDDISLRATAGSSITTPYAGLVSGFVKITPNVTPTLDVLTQPNPQLQPETTVAYDLGMDQRMRNGSVFSIDAFDNVIHNVFVNIAQPVANLPGRSASGITQTLQNETINGPQQMSYGLEATMQKRPALGFGYYTTITAQRAFYYGFSNAFYQQLEALNPNGPPVFTGLVNGKQLDGTGGFEDQIPYFKGKFEANYMFPRQRAYAALGFVWNGSNNPYGTPAFITSYANGRYDIGNGLSLGVSVENLMNYSQGSFNGQVINNAGFAPWAVAWNPACKCLINGTTSQFLNSAVVVQPRAVYVSLTKKL